MFTPAKWLAYPDAQGRSYEVTYEELRQVYPVSYLEQVKRQGCKTNHSFVVIPPGASKAHAVYPYDNDGKPLIKFYQPKKSRICLTTSLANCLYFCNCREHGGKVFNQQKLCSMPTAVVLLKEYLVSKLSILLKCQNVENLELSQLQTEFYNKAVVTCLKGSDQKTDHTVTIYSGWIFDSTFTHALPLSKESLDHCCSEDESRCEFVDFVNPFVFTTFDSYVEQCRQGDMAAKQRRFRYKKKKEAKKKKKLGMFM